MHWEHYGLVLIQAQIKDQGLYITQLGGQRVAIEISESYLWSDHFTSKATRLEYLSVIQTTGSLDWTMYCTRRGFKLGLKFFNLFTRVLKVPVDGVELSLFVSCMPIIQAPSSVVHDFVMMTNEFLAPNGTILACDIIGNGEFQQPKM